MAPAFLVCQGSPEFIRTWLQHADTDVARQRRPRGQPAASRGHSSSRGSHLSWQHRAVVPQCTQRADSREPPVGSAREECATGEKAS
jgi:hypothetical protein